MTEQNFQNEQSATTTQSEVKPSQNYKPYVYTAIIAVIAVTGLGYYLIPTRPSYEVQSIPDMATTTQSSDTGSSINTFGASSTSNSNTEPIACTMDAMMCPDGSYVGRSGANCEFVCASVGFTYNQFPDFEVIFPAEYKEIANQVKSYSGVDERVVLYNTGDISVIPRVAEMTIISGDYMVPEGPYSKFHTINANGRIFNVYDTQCRGDIFGCQLTRMTTRLSKHTIIFDVAFHTGEGSPASLADQEAHIARIKINEK
jgi:hypothetical protein